MTQLLRVGFGLKGCERTDLGTFHAQRALGGRGRAQTCRVEAFFGIGTGGGGSGQGKAAGKGCGKCKGKGGVECQGCKGTGKNKKNGNMFERWKCFDCQGFGLVKCPNCGAGGLTPEQRGER
ncbi:uncharacterized protein [Physcomitrium patens]|uniref:Uncharacterized protein n=1 Tax=Physcomitrium patens TaxID=3218 RepID=A9T6P3_PHYPA|nr:protein PHOTOSYSTEM I ASSEMBLY 2, chloroplastic-like [Physcomitrium patens]PNR34138.1 hypothetical protein PHYPA_023955 [Physcomitrium patens]|eukprot:XP_024403618.1 protein PHOTOSYSTEM I ASSEMBLY 2, chloroplastic-like [Physcomitrella patens]